jgi:hypothetical protein
MTFPDIQALPFLCNVGTGMANDLLHHCDVKEKNGTISRLSG